MIFNLVSARLSALPELDSSYPRDISGVVAFPYTSTEVTFEVRLAREGIPKACTYQWYVNGAAVPDSDSPGFSYTVKANGTAQIYCEVSNGLGQVLRSRTATVTGRAAKQLLYDRGQEFADISGGWLAFDSGAADDPDYYGAAEKQSGKLHMTAKKSACYGGRCVTAAKLDLRNYTTLVFSGYAWGKVTAALAAGQGEGDILIHKESSPYNTSTGWSGTLTLDVSNQDEGYVMALAGPAQSADCYGEITQIWLE